MDNRSEEQAPVDAANSASISVLLAEVEACRARLAAMLEVIGFADMMSGTDEEAVLEYTYAGLFWEWEDDVPDGPDENSPGTALRIQFRQAVGPIGDLLSRIRDALTVRSVRSGREHGVLQAFTQLEFVAHAAEFLRSRPLRTLHGLDAVIVLLREADRDNAANTNSGLTALAGAPNGQPEDAEGFQSSPPQHAGVVQHQQAVAAQASSTSNPPRAKPGPKRNIEAAIAVAQIVSKTGDPWKDHLRDICEVLDAASIPYPKTWHKRTLQNWTDAADMEPELAKKAIEHHLKNADQ